MSLGKVIRKYRKIRNMTQEEMAARLGVTAPAVNKWENENSCPDIMLLAPIARLLNISLDELLSFREDLTMEEINEIVREADKKLKEQSYDEAFAWAKKKLEQYPSCEPLVLNIAILFDARRVVQEIPNETEYDEYLSSLYVRVLGSLDEATRIKAADCLISFYTRKKQYGRAIMAELLSNVEQIGSYRNAPLYEHMEFREPKEEFLAELKEKILNCFRDEEIFGFLKEDSRWQELVKN